MNCSPDVKFEGKNVPRSFDLMLHNNKNTPPTPVLQQPVVSVPKQPEDVVCLCCKKKL